MFTDGPSDALPEVNPDSEWRKWMEQLKAPAGVPQDQVDAMLRRVVELQDNLEQGGGAPLRRDDVTVALVHQNEV